MGDKYWENTKEGGKANRMVYTGRRGFLIKCNGMGHLPKHGLQLAEEAGHELNKT